ncbi:YcbK family protein (plasmid) [Trichlorobacter lovleyi]|uniref:YcbK family protein n=1 Tax=Trichlorobacter lovleyi TaxID=313985 RepID=UPI002240287C|nr:DUF882 domain-containing protein [Trichlorobacter lovleyi]QOX80930.1 YcbK family protein [Trichlorobacter lovleyi]
MVSRREFICKLGLCSAAMVWAGSVPSRALASAKWLDGWAGDDHEDMQEGPLPAVQDLKGATPEFCPGVLRLKSSIHGGSYEFRFRDQQGKYDENILAALNWFLRCKDGTWQHMDITTIETLNYVSALLGVPEIQVNSGYRSPAYNAWLARKNENVARNSLHQYGMAIDFTVPGMSARDVCSYTLYARNVMGRGGVGYYPKAGFVHLDSGKAKEWVR